jgi:ABC-2 type transport system ATP-binding protein
MRAQKCTHRDFRGSMQAATPALEISNLRVDYGRFTAVNDLSLSLERGEIFGLAGPNGAGKTSTIRVLATLQEPTYGNVSVTGIDLFERPDKVHAALGYMPDLAPVIPDLKVWEFLDLYAASHGYRGSEKRDRVDASLAKVKLSEKREVFGKALSRGMTQRVVLAKTLLHDPALLLLDEPASGMDPIARRDMRRILQELAANGATIVISSHILSELSGMCTSVGIMHLGNLLRWGSIDTVLGAAEAEIVEIQMEVLEGLEAVTALLQGRDDTGVIRTEGKKLIFTLRGDRRACSELLALLVGSGIQVSAFTPGRSGIESLLMELVEERL